MSTTLTPRLGAIVLYTLSETDVREIVQRRREAGLGSARGNDPHEGDTYPAMIVRDWAQGPEERKAYLNGKVTDGDGSVRTWRATLTMWSCNLQVFLDGNDSFWAASRSMGELGEKGHWSDEQPTW